MDGGAIKFIDAGAVYAFYQYHGGGNGAVTSLTQNRYFISRGDT